MPQRVALTKAQLDALAPPAPRIRGGKRVLQPVRPNQFVAHGYQAKLEGLIDEMDRSLRYWISAAYRQNPPEIAQDASPAAMLRAVLAVLSRRWRKRFRDAAEELARYFATETSQRSTTDLHSILRRGGFSVRFKMTRSMNDVLQATVHENVSLIRSIAEQHLTAVEGHVMRSVQAGRKLDELTKVLQHQFGVTRRRAELIARDQSNKATAAFVRVRQQDARIVEAEWVHSHAGKEPRPTHVKAGRERQRYKVAEGWYDPAIKKHIWPGTEINCRCLSRSVIPGLDT